MWFCGSPARRQRTSGQTEPGKSLGRQGEVRGGQTGSRPPPPAAEPRWSHLSGLPWEGAPHLLPGLQVSSVRWALSSPAV